MDEESIRKKMRLGGSFGLEEEAISTQAAHQSMEEQLAKDCTTAQTGFPPSSPSMLPTGASFGSYYGVSGRRSSIAPTPPSASPRSTGSRNSSPPRAGSADFARGDITPPSIPFREDSPLPHWDSSRHRSQASTVPQVYPSSYNAGYNEYLYCSIASDQVRLLALHAGNSDTAINCTLKTMHVSDLEDSQLGYHALSYAWGEESPVEKIFIYYVLADSDGPSQSSHVFLPREFYIRPNLHSALKRLRCEDKDVWFWIDAICINQGNIKEKSHQIPKMLDIYRNAWSVCIWLGETEEAMRLHGACQDPLDFVSIIVNLKLLDRIFHGHVAEETLASFVSFANLLKRPWFRRRWVIQEVAASKRAFVQCGDKKVNWVDFADAVQLFLANIERIRTIYDRSELSRWNPNAFGHVESVGAGAIVRAASSVLRKSEEGKIVARLWNIESLVVTFLHYEASDTRDTIYALLSLANDNDFIGALSSSNLLDQSYEKSTTQVYAEFVEHSIKSRDSLDIICRHWALPPRGQFSPKLPSWAGVVTDAPFGPSPKATGRLNGDSLVGKPGHKIYNASRGSHPSVRLYVPSYQSSWTPAPPPVYSSQTTSQSPFYRIDYKLPVAIPVDVQEASRIADERRRRNAGASARFRARRLEREREASVTLLRLSQDIRKAKEDVEFYRGERDALVQLLGPSNLPRPESPRHRRGPNLECEGFSGHGSTSDGMEQDSTGPLDNPNRIENMNRTPGINQSDNTAQTGNTNHPDIMDNVEQSTTTESSQVFTTASRGTIATGPEPATQSRVKVSAVLQSVSASPRPSHHTLPTKGEIRNVSGSILKLGSSITLLVTGFRLCRITQVSSRVVDGVISHDCLEIAGWDRRADINDIPDRLWRTLVADRTSDGSNAPSWWRRACMYCLSKSSPDGDLNTSKLIANRSFPETVVEFLRRVQATVWNRRFFACRGEPDADAATSCMVGLGSRNIQEGDWCCILWGCSVPVVLREEEKQVYRFVGECYVDGMMDGQALAGGKEGCISTTEFAIR